MNGNRTSLIVALLVWQGIRFGLLVALLASRWQSSVLWFVMIGTLLDAVVLNRIFKRHGLLSTVDKLLPELGRRDAKNFGLLGMILYLCATGFAGSVPLINGTSTVLPEGAFGGDVTVAELATKSDGCYRLTDGTPQIEFLGAVKYSVTVRVKEFFYAVPFETTTWNSREPVRVWAILSEAELNQGRFAPCRFAMIVPAHNIHADAFRAAVTNAEERFGMAPNVSSVMIRLLDSQPADLGLLGHATTWIAMIYGFTWLLSVPYAMRAFGPEQMPDDSLRHSRAGGNPVAADVIALDPRLHGDDGVRGDDINHEATATPTADAGLAFLRRRSSWFALHVCGFAALAILLCNSSVVWPGFVLMGVLPVVEFVLALKAFRNPDVRRSGRFALLAWLLPTGLFFALLLLAISALGFAESRETRAAGSVTNMEDLDRGTSGLTHSVRRDGGRGTWQLVGDFTLREDLAGSFWAPNDTSKVRRMTPVVTSDWCAEMPVRIWIESTDRDEARFAGEPLRYVRRTIGTHDLRRTEAQNDALKRYELKSAPDALVVERVIDPERRSSDAGGFLVLGLLLNFLPWCLSACCWPKMNSDATLAAS